MQRVGKFRGSLRAAGVRKAEKGGRRGAERAWEKARRVRRQKRERLNKKRDRLLADLGLESGENWDNVQRRPRKFLEKEELEGQLKRKQKEEQRKAKEVEYERDRKRREEQKRRRRERNKAFRKVNARGQPLLSGRMEALLEKIEKAYHNEVDDAKEKSHSEQEEQANPTDS